MNISSQIWECLIQFSRDASQDDPPMSIETSLIKKTRKRDQMKKFTTHSVQITDDLAHGFRRMLAESLQKHGFRIQGSIPTIKNFMDPSLEDSEDLYVIPRNVLRELDGLLNELKTHNDITPVIDISSTKGATLYCFEARLDDESVFVISAIHNPYPENKDLITTEFKKGKIDTVEKKIIQFSKEIFCIYVKTLDLLLVLNSPQTIKKLRLNDQYKAKAKEIIKNKWEVVAVPEETLDDVLGNNQYNQMLVKMHASERLQNNIDHYQNYNKFCNDHQDLGLKPLTIHDKVFITQSKHLESALHVSDNTIVEGVLSKGDYSLALRRKPLGR